MCGICGAVNVDRARPADARLVEAMLARLVHRGPDGGGLREGQGAVLGHRRLAIIDLSEKAAQPLPGEDDSLFAVVNGEIYNHRDLRARLESRGHRFRSRTDSEVVVHLYEEHGLEAIEKLEGMFALAIWDGHLEALILARDTMGEKPLYYHEDASRILFASEIGALLADPALPAAPDALAIHHYLTFKFVPSPDTGLREVRKIPPAHLLLWERGRGSLERYAAPPRPSQARARLGLSARDAARLDPARVRETIGLAVAGRLESDVPMGVLLSGGLDSAIVAAEAARVVGGSLETFTVGFDETDYDESEGAALVARHIGSHHHRLRASPDLAAELPAMAAHFGEPFGDSSAAAVWMLAREVRRHVTVALGGDGGDELFGGYDRHRAVRLYRTLRRSGAGPLLPLVGQAASLLPLKRMRRNVAGRLDRFGRGATENPREANGVLLGCFSDAEKRALYRAGAGDGVADVASLDLLRRSCEEGADPLEDALYADLVLALPDQLLFKVDIASMASSLEVRSPLLAGEVVALAAALPVVRKVGLRQGKMILREAYAGVLPERTLRTRKAGFGLPVDRWLRGPLREMARDLLLDGEGLASRGFDAGAIRGLLEEHAAGRSNHDDRIWTLLGLELWFRAIVEGRAEALVRPGSPDPPLQASHPSSRTKESAAP